MRILHVNYTFGVVGGTETYLLNLIRDLGARGHHSEVAAERDDTDGSIAPFHEVTEVEWSKPRWWLRWGWRFRAIVRQTRPDVIYLHNTMNPDLVELAAKLRPTIRYVHDHTVFCPGLNKIYADGGICDRPMGDWCIEKYADGGCLCLRHPTEERVRKQVDHTRSLFDKHRALGRIVVASDYMRGELERAGMDASRVDVIPYYTARPDAVTPVADDDTPLILTLARLSHPDKGVVELLDALARLDVPYRARIVGTGQHEEMLRAHAERLALGDRVEFAGFVAHEQTLAMMADARVIAFPSMWNEPFGIVGIEAMARARPVVAFDVGGVREWLADGETGIVVPRGDVDGYAAALQTLLTDADRARSLGDAGPARVAARFERDAHVQALEKALLDAAASEPAGATASR